jgi:prepilin-type N-terminal cleavage/methylation domain-containing protein
MCDSRLLAASATHRRGYSLIELLVVMSIVVLLTGVLLPTLSSVRDAANRVISKSNQRNIGAAISMFADGHGQDLPESDALSDPLIKAGDLMRVWSPESLSHFSPNRKYANWLVGGFDGLGRLFQYSYLSEAEVFYSPGHTGAHPYTEYEQNWRDLQQVMTARIGNEDINPGRTIYSNYHYAGHQYWDPEKPINTRRERRFSDPGNSVLLADGMRRSSDLNFDGGLNVLRMDLSVEWHEDWKLAGRLPMDGQDAIDSGSQASLIWSIFQPE